MEKGKIKYVYPGGNTAKGFHSFYISGLQEMERIFVLKGGPGTGKSTLMRKIGLAMAEQGYDVEFWQCSSDNDSLDGVLIPGLKAAVIDGTAPHIVDPRYPGVVDEIVNLGEHWDEDKLREAGEEIKKITNEISGSFSTAYGFLKDAKEVHDRWKKIHIEAMDFKKADNLTEALVREIFRTPEPVVRHLFASAITPKGMLNFIDNITEDCRVRFIIKGLPGTGKSTLTQKVVQAAAGRGLKVDVYHCSFDPESVDMVVIPALGTAVIDGTHPHVVDPNRPGDKIIDMRECLDMEQVNKAAAQIADIESQFNHLTGEAVKNIARAKALHDELESYYIEAMDFDGVNETRNKVFHKIFALISKHKR